MIYKSVSTHKICVENQKYREQANRERFVLPEDKEISYFSNAIQKSIEFLKK